MHVLHKTGHPLAFGAIAVLTLIFLQSGASITSVSIWPRYALAFGVAVMLGILTEVAQLFTNRGSSALDVLRDAVGATATLGIFSSVFIAQRISQRRSIRSVALIVGVAAAGVALAPLFWCAAAYVNREARFPVMLKIDTPLDSYFVSGTNNASSLVSVPASWARSHGEQALDITFKLGGSSGIQIIEPHPDWRGYQTLKLDITNASANDLPVAIRVHDRQHNWQYVDRFNRSIQLKALTRQIISVPIADIVHGPQSRTMDISHIANLAVFVWQPQSGGQFLLHSITLE